jgi:RHS repeat-associated protein
MTGLPQRKSAPLGIATVDPWTDDGADNTEYFHTNHLGTTRFMSDPDGDPVDAAVYTAFGERVDGTNHRYGYAGAWGYQTHDFPSGDEIPYLHVGARYYDPASGRFLQRDPIGIMGGLNVYEYCFCAPLSSVDPSGRDRGSWYPGGDDYEKAKKRRNSPEQRRKTREWIERLGKLNKALDPNAPSHSIEDMEIMRDYYQQNATLCGYAISAVGGTWAIARKSAVGFVAAAVNAILNWWRSYAL